MILYYQNNFAEGFLAETSVLMMNSYYSRPYEFFVNNNSAVLLRGLNEDIGNTKNELLNLLQIVQESFTFLALGVFLIYTDWVIAVSELIFAVICFFAIRLL